MIKIFNDASQVNCLSACLASILEKKLDDFPNFYIEYYKQKKHKDYLDFVNFHLSPEKIKLKPTKETINDYHIKIISIFDTGSHHAVVGLGDKIIHDPDNFANLDNNFYICYNLKIKKHD